MYGHGLPRTMGWICQCDPALRFVPYLIAAVAARASATCMVKFGKPYKRFCVLGPSLGVVIARGVFLLGRTFLAQVGWQAMTTAALGELQEVKMQGKTVLVTGATSGLGLWQAEARNPSRYRKGANVSKLGTCRIGYPKIHGR